MYLQRLLQINLATLAGLATLLLSMGEDNPSKPLLVWLAAGASIWLTDVRGWLRLNRTMARRCRPLAGRLVRRPLDARLGGDARIFVSPTWWSICNWSSSSRRKTARSTGCWRSSACWKWWWPPGSATGRFGVLLVIYMLTGLSALALLSCTRSGAAISAAGAAAPASGRAAAAAAGRPRVHAAARWAAAERASWANCSCGWRMLGIGTLVSAPLVIFFTVPRLGPYGLCGRHAAVPRPSSASPIPSPWVNWARSWKAARK